MRVVRRGERGRGRMVVGKGGGEMGGGKDVVCGGREDEEKVRWWIGC